MPVLASAVEQQEAADAADTLETLTDDEAADVLEQMEDRSAADALAEMETPLAMTVLDDLVVEGKQAYAARLIDLMAPDDGADLLRGLDDQLRDHLSHCLRDRVASGRTDCRQTVIPAHDEAGRHHPLRALTTGDVVGVIGGIEREAEGVAVV